MGGLTNSPNGLTSFGLPVLPPVAGVNMTGNVWFVNPASGSDGNTGKSPSRAFQTLYKAYASASDGNNDVIYLIGNGASSGSARLSLANAQSVDSTATAGTLTWAKSALHLVGVAAPTRVGQRARIAPPTGTYTASTFGANTFFSVTGQGCIFANIDVFVGFSTGSATMVGWSDTGGRNSYINMNFQGLSDAASAGGSGARTLLISGTTGENTFVNCVIGEDTTARSAANASIEFAGGTPRNTFVGCTFPFQCSASSPLGFIVSAAAGIDRWQLFDRCTFLNNVQSTSTTMAGLSTLAASAGGMIVMKDCTLVGITEFGTDATSRGQIYVDGGTVTAATSGIAVNPT